MGVRCYSAQLESGLVGRRVDGAEKMGLWERPVEKVYGGRESLEPRLADRQHYFFWRLMLH